MYTRWRAHTQATGESISVKLVADQLIACFNESKVWQPVPGGGEVNLEGSSAANLSLPLEHNALLIYAKPKEREMKKLNSFFSKNQFHADTSTLSARGEGENETKNRRGLDYNRHANSVNTFHFFPPEDTQFFASIVEEVVSKVNNCEEKFISHRPMFTCKRSGHKCFPKWEKKDCK